MRCIRGEREEGWGMRDEGGERNHEFHELHELGLVREKGWGMRYEG